ncbi:MAG: VWA domain-containing protein [Anaerolineae bacterium]|nr:VWA domain-containing protein [Anaerolineae bacterium]
MRLKPWEIILLIVAAICVAIFVLARTVGARSTSREGIVSRVARPGVAFWPEPVDVDVRIDARTLPADAAAGDVAPIQAALVIDRSGSMSGTPLAEAKNAASDFVDLMDLQKNGDGVAVIVFADTAYVRQRFTFKSNEAIQAIQGIDEGGGTNIAAGLTEAARELAGQTIQPDTRQIIILLSDGQSDSMAAIAAASAAKAQNVRVVTIALGNADQTTLQKIASSPTDYYTAADPTALMGIYGDIAEGMVGSVATDITVQEYFNDQSFALTGSLYRAEQTGNQLNWELPFMGKRGRTARYQLQPLGLGMPRVSVTPGQMSLVDSTGQTVTQATPTGPRVLVLFPVWLLFPIPAVALLWLLYRIIQALRPAPARAVSAPGMRTGSMPGKKVEKEVKKPVGASIEHGRPKKPPIQK